MSEVTSILARIGLGNPQAAEKLLPLVYDELRKLAARRIEPGKTGRDTAGHGAGARSLSEMNR